MSSGDPIPTADNATIIHPINGNAKPTSRNGDFMGRLSRKMIPFASTPLADVRNYAFPAKESWSVFSTKHPRLKAFKHLRIRDLCL